MKINKQYSLKTTEDGSPTLVLSTDGDQLFVEEKMHSRYGAASETDYIYGPAIKWAFENVDVPRFVVVGLGLGYIEFLIVREALKRNSFCEIHSYETDDFLKDCILSWIHEDEVSPLDIVLNSALSYMTGTHSKNVKEQLRILHENGKWRLFGSITESSSKLSYNCVLYDLFSQKISPELWQEQFLTDFLAVHAAPVCSFATYASKGALKRSLRSAGFDQWEQKGFANKRESTLAFRAAK